MFRQELSDKLSEIFGIKRVTYNAPSNDPEGAFEQGTLFIEIDHAPSRIQDGKITAKVMGSILIFSSIDKIPFGYFNRRIEQANSELTSKFLFFEIDINLTNSQARIQNLMERRTRFIYLYSAQYDPSQGNLTSLNLEGTIA